MLSGCSWLGGFGGAHSGYNTMAQSGGYGSAHSGQAKLGPQLGPCQIYSPNQAVPRGCDPASVTLATPGGHGQFPQSPDFGSGQYVSGGYGSHAAQAGQQSAHYTPKKRIRKPKLRGTMSLGFEKSFSGDYLDYATFPVSDPSATYDPNVYAEGSTTGTPSTGQTTTTIYTAVVEDIQRPNISFDDVHSTPMNLKGGFEYIMTPKTTLFANAGYSYAEGEDGGAVLINGELQRRVTTQDYDTSTGNPVGPPVTNVGFIPNRRIAEFDYDFNDMTKIDLEAGARHYFSPIMEGQTRSSITPFVGASAGVAHYNAQSFNIAQRQVFFERAYTSGGTNPEFYNVDPGTTITVDVYDGQWVPKGALTTGLEWQMTPKTALAFETGVNVEGGRKYLNGERGDSNISIPVTLRGSFNF